MTDKFVSSILIAASILLFFLMVLPAFDKTAALRGSVGEREKILQEMEEIQNRVQELVQEMDSRETEVDRLDLLLPKEKMIPELLSSIESIVAGSGLSLTGINVAELSSQDKKKKLSGDLKLSGSFPSFMNFLDLLEKNLRLINLTTVDASAQLTGGGNAINYSLRFETNYLSKE